MTTKPQFKLGDMITRLTKALHIPHCVKCEKRRLILNEIRKLGLRETLKRLKVAGSSVPARGKAPSKQSLEDLVHKLEDCCDESR